jgi:hypothetical protein
MSSFLGRPSLGGKSVTSMTSRRREQFSFPILTHEEIVQCLSEMGLHADEDDLVKGKPESVRNTYELLLFECLGLTKEELYQPKLAGLDAITNEELHEESIPTLHFVRAMCVLPGSRETDSAKHTLTVNAVA